MPSTGAKGPHGSPNRYILVAPWNPTDATGIRTGDVGAGDTSSHLCFRCHDYNFYTGVDQTVYSQFWQGGTKNKHNHAVGCAKCHGGLPHGWKYTDSNGGGVALFKPTDPLPYSEGLSPMLSYSGSGGIPGSWTCSTCHSFP